MQFANKYVNHNSTETLHVIGWWFLNMHRLTPENEGGKATFWGLKIWAVALCLRWILPASRKN